MKKLPYLLLLLGVLSACSTLNRDKYEGKVREYLDQFEKNLLASDEIILQQFKVEKNPEVLLRAIRIMQNKDLREDSIQCLIDFSAAHIVFEEENIRVEVRALHKSIRPDQPMEKETTFTLWLKSDNGKLSIIQMEAEDFYQEFYHLSFQLGYQKHLAKAYQTRQKYFEEAKQIQQQYDTVIWYARHRDSTYYYVVKGAWEHYFNDRDKTKPDYKMGLVNAQGRIIVPVAYDLIGTIGFEQDNVIEVKREGKVGHYSLDGKERIPALYDWIIPYSSDSIYALVKNDSTYGWIDKQYTYTEGFPDPEAASYVKEFTYLAKPMSITPDRYTMIEPLDIENIGMAKVIPSQHFVSTGLFKEVVDNFILDYEEYDGETWGTEAINKKDSFFSKVSDQLSTLYTTLQVHYLGGREEFYDDHVLAFLDNNGNQIATHDLHRGYKEIKLIDSTLLEFNLTANAIDLFTDAYSWSFNKSEQEWNLPTYAYFRIKADNSGVERLQSKRDFDFTEFVKMDSSYLQGKFYFWSPQKEDTTSSNFLSQNIIKHMRNEILAAYGYDFPDPKIHEDYKYDKWYKPRFKKYEDFWDDMTEIDKHNLQFLESLLPKQAKPSA